MDITTAKQTVIDAGNRLVASGLIARTWGNVSCRLDADSFVITPSGKAYDALTPADIVLVKTDTLDYDGDVKPSSEKGVHAEVYKARPDIHFVIHTHQNNASVISALSGGLPALAPEDAAVIGELVPLGSYGLPGTGKLRQGVAAALAQTAGKAIIMAHHGALCYGTDSEDAFRVASTLEDACAKQLAAQYQKLFGKQKGSETDYVETTVKKLTKCEINVANSEKVCYTSAHEAGSPGFALRGSDGSELDCALQIAAQEEPPEAQLHRAVYRARKDIQVILHSQSPAAIGVSASVKKLRPQLDDFAQIIGVNLRRAAYTGGNAAAVVKALKRRHAVLLQNEGALCCGKNESDARAVEMILEKGCQTHLGSLLFGDANYIKYWECLLMRFIYLTKYSKKA